MQGDLVTNKPNLLQILFQPVVLVYQLIHPVLQVEVKLSRDGDEMNRAQIKTIEHLVIILRHRESGLVVAEVVMVFMVPLTKLQFTSILRYIHIHIVRPYYSLKI